MSNISYQASHTDPMSSAATADNVSSGEKAARLDRNYVKSRSGILKLIEAIICLLVFVCATIAVRNYAVFYGCAVWGSVIGFLCMTASVALLVAHAASMRWPTLETVYCACAAIAFLIAGVLLVLVAEAAITIPRGHILRSSIADDRMTLDEAEQLLGPLTNSDSFSPHTTHWVVKITPANAHGYRAAVCAAVFSFVAAVLFAVDTYFTNTERTRHSFRPVGSVSSSSRYKAGGIV